MRRPGRNALTGVIAAGLACALTGSAVAGSAPSPDRGLAKRAAAPAHLAVRSASARVVSGRIAVHATIVNTGRARARHTTGALALTGQPGGALGVRTFSLASLAPGRSHSVRFTTGAARAFPLGSGRFATLLCADIYSQVGRFSTTNDCTGAGEVAVASPAGPVVRSERIPKSVLRSRPSRASRSATAVLRFGSGPHRGRFRCSLDGGPWLACASPRRYTALVDGPHTFAVRAISNSGRHAAVPARISWSVDRVAPTVVLNSPANGSTTTDNTPAFSGTGGTASSDLPTITVKIYAGTSVAGSAVQTFTTTMVGANWSVAAGRALANGTYTAQAQQSDTAHNTGRSNAVTFKVSTPPPPPPMYSISGSVSGLSGTVVLQDNGGDNLNVGANGSFTFATKIAKGGAYKVTVASNPTGQTCTVANGAGTVGSANVTNVKVTCVSPPPPATYSIGGTASGLSGTVVLQDNGGDNLSVSANGSFAFATKIASGGAYQVTVANNPTGQQCSVANGSGTVGSANVTNVAVTCATTPPPPPATYSIGGAVSGLSGTVVVQDNGGDDLSLSANGSFAFATKIATGGAYKVTVKSTPSGQQCSVSNGSGTVSSANVTNVAVACAATASQPGADDFNRADADDLGAGWTAFGSPDGGLSIASQHVIGTAAPAYAGDIRTAAGESYGSDQYSQIVLTANSVGIGTGGAGEWVGPSVRSQNGGQDTYLGMYFYNSGSPQLRLYRRNGGTWTQLGGNVNSGALPAGTQLTLTAIGSRISLAENGVAQITVTDTTLTGGAPGIITYDAATADNWSGGDPATLPPPPSYSVGGTASGVSGTLVLQDNGGDDLNVSANGSFTFPTKIVSGGAYQVTVKSNPSGETCSVSNGSGTVGSANVTTVTVTCVTSPPPPPNSYSIGGTVSGLAGIVVLQDNGGDDLNVSANGSFTFPTKIVTGATYQVTVASNPAGQTCTVASGSGTVGSANVTTVTVTCSAASNQIGADNFNRADASGLGAGWTAMGDGGLGIKSQQVIGTAAPAYAGDIRTAAGESYGSDQYSEIELTANSVGIGTGGGGEWVGPSVRSQNGGQDTYLGMYFYNGGSPQLRLYVRDAGTWTQLGGNVNSGALPAGTQLTLTAVGSRISLAENGVAQITVTDTTLTGGAPGIMTYDAATADTWSGGNADALPPPEKMQVQFDHTDGGVDYYNVISSDDGGGAQVLRVLNPTNPAPGVPHNFLFALPVEPGVQTTYGDGIGTLQQLSAQNQYNVTIIEPSFGAEPWYADNPTDPNLQYETFMSDDLAPWAAKNLATTGNEQNWLLGFSKSGFGAQDMILKHPDVFTVAASWDFPADMDAYTSDQGRYVGDGVDYGTDANFQANYRLTAGFVNAHKAPFQSANRLWIGSYNAFAADVSDYDALLTSDGIKHSTETPQLMAHRWDSGWVPIALQGLSADGAALPPGP